MRWIIKVYGAVQHTRQITKMSVIDQQLFIKKMR